MKYFKLTALAFIMCIAIHSIYVKADSYRSFANISIPKSSSYYESGEYTKDIDNYQYYRNQTTDGGLLGTSNVIARTHSSTRGTSSGLQVNQGQEKTWGNVVNQYAANYKIRICSTSVLTGAKHWGHWLLDGRLASNTN